VKKQANAAQRFEDYSKMTREQWLLLCVEKLRPLFAAQGATIPDTVRVTCGFPSKGALSAKKRTIGQCWSPTASQAGNTEILISPTIADTLEVAGVLAHELVHAIVGIPAGHKAPFRKLALAIGLAGKMTATVPGDGFKAWFAQAKLPQYPHAILDMTQIKKQSTRMLKAFCPHCAAEDQKYIVRLSASTAEIGLPICPIHNEPLELA